MTVGDCSVTERRRWRPPNQTGKTVHVHAKHYKHNEDGRTAPGVCDNGSVPLSHSGNVVTRIGTHTHAVLILFAVPICRFRCLGLVVFCSFGFLLFNVKILSVSSHTFIFMSYSGQIKKTKYS